MNKLDLFRKLYSFHKKGNDWLDTVPHAISPAIFDNPYVDAFRSQLDALQVVVFTEDQLSDIDWFLFDWSVTPTLAWEIAGKEYSFSDIEEYIQFLQEHRSEVWDEQPQPERVDYPNGTSMWYLNSELHRTDGPAVIYANGTCEWCLNGKRHRTDGPAIEYPDGSRSWWLNDKLHREDGPAYEQSDGLDEWWINGEEYTFEEFVAWCRLNGKTIPAKDN